MGMLKSKSFIDELRISVIIATYNNADYIDRAVTSVINQAYDSYEIIVVDDGSTDDTHLVLQSYSDHIKYVYQQNQGVSAARNHGLSLARGEYIVFLDGDDILLPDKLFEQAAYLDKRPALGCVHSGWHLINGQDEIIRTLEPWHNTPKLDLETWLLWKPVFLGAMMIRRNWLESVDGFNTGFPQAEDVDLLLRLALTGCPIEWIYLPTVCYRIHSNNTMRNGLEQGKSIILVLDDFFARKDLPRRISRLEKKVRYYTLIWIIWQLYRTGYSNHISEYLKSSLKLSTYYPVMKFITLDWAEKLARHCIRDGCDIGVLRFFLPHFKEATQLDIGRWMETEDLLNWWLDVWQFYFYNHHHRSIMDLFSCKTLNGFRYAVKSGFRPEAWWTWFRFFQAALNQIKMTLAGIVSRNLYFFTGKLN